MTGIGDTCTSYSVHQSLEARHVGRNSNSYDWEVYRKAFDAALKIFDYLPFLKKRPTR
jgi:hypothetical protein